MVIAAGFTSIEATGENVRTVEPVMVPDVAVMMVDPVLDWLEVTSPVLSTVANEGFAESQVTP